MPKCTLKLKEDECKGKSRKLLNCRILRAPCLLFAFHNWLENWKIGISRLFRWSRVDWVNRKQRINRKYFLVSCLCGWEWIRVFGFESKFHRNHFINNHLTEAKISHRWWTSAKCIQVELVPNLKCLMHSTTLRMPCTGPFPPFRCLLSSLLRIYSS